jgi:sirohydrochlorin ferrochelatase
MTGPLVLVAHGSRDLRAAPSTWALARAVGAARPATGVRPAFLDFAGPRLGPVLTGVAHSAAPTATVVPLLLTAAYHGRVDVPGEIRRALDGGSAAGERAGLAQGGARGGLAAPGGARGGLAAPGAARGGLAAPGGDRAGPAAPGDRAGLSLRVRLAEVLGPVAGPVLDRVAVDLMVAALVRRLDEAGALAADAVLLAAAGSRQSGALDTVDLVAAALSGALGRPCRAGYASGAGRPAGTVVDELRRSGAGRVAVAGYFLAPGLLHDRAVAQARTAGADLVAAPLGDAPEIVELVLRRADAATVVNPTEALACTVG